MINQSNRLGVEELESRVVPAWISWVGGSGDWADPVNWSGGKVPTAQDDVTISDWFNNLTITIGTGTNAAVRSLSASESLVVEGSLAIHNWANVSGFVEIASGGAIDVPTTGSYISMTGGSEISGDFHIAEKGFVNLDGDSILHTSGTLSGKGQYGIYSKLTFSGGGHSRSLEWELLKAPFLMAMET